VSGCYLLLLAVSRETVSFDSRRQN